MRRRRFIGLAGASALLAGAGAARWDFDRVLGAARSLATTGGTVIPTRAGAMEYAEAGAGPPVLMIRGTGGGFDQGLAFGRPLTRAGWRVIAPSRFGYLVSDFPEDASSEAQADAVLDLLDHLGIDRLGRRRSPSRSRMTASAPPSPRATPP